MATKAVGAKAVDVTPPSPASRRRKAQATTMGQWGPLSAGRGPMRLNVHQALRMRQRSSLSLTGEQEHERDLTFRTDGEDSTCRSDAVEQVGPRVWLPTMTESAVTMGGMETVDEESEVETQTGGGGGPA